MARHLLTNRDQGSGGGGTGDPLYPGAPSYTSAADVRADLDILTEDEAKAIFAEVNGARTENYLPKFNADGELEASGLLDNGSRVATTLSTLLGGTGTPARKLEIVDSANPQVQLTHTAGTHWVGLQAVSGGGLTLTSPASIFELTMPYNTHITANGILRLYSGASSILQLNMGTRIAFVAANGFTKLGQVGHHTYFRGISLKFFSPSESDYTPGASQAAFIANATDATSTQALVNSLKSILVGYGLMAAS